MWRAGLDSGVAHTRYHARDDFDCEISRLSARIVLSTVTVHSRLPTLVRLTVVTELSEVRVQTAARVNEWVSTLLEGMRVFVEVQAVAPVFSESTSAGGWCKKATPQRRVIGLD